MKEHYLLQFFQWIKPDDAQAAQIGHINNNFERLARMIQDLPSNPETTTALRKLLEAKTAAVRSVLFRPVEAEEVCVSMKPL